MIHRILRCVGTADWSRRDATADDSFGPCPSPSSRSRSTIPDADLDDLRERLARTRLSEQLPDAGWDYGTERGYLAELVAYWRDEYDWRRAEATLNAFDNFLTEVDGTRVHFIHARSPEPDALPLIVTHGWPGSVVEFMEIIRPLSDPRAHGGDPADAFHVVCPSIPGYAFSGPTRERGLGTRGASPRRGPTLMAGLGYARYGAQGGDWGSMISTQLGLADPEHVAGVHLNMVVAPPPADLDFEHLQRRRAGRAGDATSTTAGSTPGTPKIQGTKPQTIGYALDDSPAGLAGWIVEKFRTWSDCDGDVERCFTKDQLLDNIMLYWLTGTAHSAGRLYYEAEQRRVRARRTGRGPGGAWRRSRRSHPPRPRCVGGARYDSAHWTDMPTRRSLRGVRSSPSCW